VRRDQHLVDPAGDEGLQRRPGRRGTEGVEPAVGQVGDPWREAEAQQAAEREHVVGDTAAVGVMDRAVDGAAMIEQPVDDVGRLALRHRDHLGVECE
jgi:hypothetical protein